MSTQTTQQKIEEVNAIRAEIHGWRIGTTLASVAVTALCLLNLHGSAMALFRNGQPRDEFAAEFKNGLVTEVAPQVRSVVDQTWKQLVPAIRAEVVTLEHRTPEMTACVQREVQTLRDDVRARTEALLLTTVADVIRQREATIQSLYGDISPEALAKIRAALTVEAQRRAARLTQVIAGPYEQSLRNIVEDLATIRETETIGETGRPTPHDVAAVLFKLAEEQFQTGPLTIQTSAAQPERLQLFADAR